MQAERACVSRILQTGKMKHAITAGLEPEFFHKYRQEFEYLKTQFSRYGEIPSPEVFCERFPDFKYKKSKGKSKDLKVAPLVHAVLENHVAIEYGLLLKDGMQRLDEMDATELVEEHIKKLTDIRRVKTIDRDVNIIEDIESDIAEVVRLRKHKDDGTKLHIPSPWKPWNDMNGGWRPGEAIGVMARLNEGKSWIAGQIATVAALEGARVYLASLEMNRFDVAMRIHSMASFYLLKKRYRKGKKRLRLPPILDKQQIEELLYGADIFRNSELVMGHSSLDIEKYQEWALALKTAMPKGIIMPDDRLTEPFTLNVFLAKLEREEVDIGVLDYLTLLADKSNKGMNKVEVWENATKEIKATSRRLGIPIIVCQQANRGGALGRHPGVEDSYMSDAFAHNMDRIISLKQNETVLKMVCTKNRMGPKNWQWQNHFWPDYGVIEYIRQSGIEFDV